MTTHKREQVETENFRAYVRLLETDRESFRVAYSLYRVEPIRFFGRRVSSTATRIDRSYYGKMHQSWHGVEDALEAFEDCKDHVLARMKNREDHLEALADD